jgi:hypothetical protein
MSLGIQFLAVSSEAINEKVDLCNDSHVVELENPVIASSEFAYKVDIESKLLKMFI